MKPITVLLAHEQMIVRSALEESIDRGVDVVVVAAPEDGDDTLRAVRGHGPDVIVYTVALPTSLEVVTLRIEQLKDASPDSAILILTASKSASVARAAIAAGALGYVLESELPADLPFAIGRVAAGQVWISPAVTMQIAKLDRDGAGIDLTARQQTIIRSISWGHTSKEIATSLSLSRRTIEASRAEILRKLNLSSRAGIVKYAVDCGLFDEADAMLVPPPALA